MATLVALVKPAAVLLGLLSFPGLLLDRKFLCFKNNTAVLAGLVKGCSSDAMLDAGMASIHLLLAALGTRTWFEWIESKANWADEASRLLEAGNWAPSHGFSMSTGQIPGWPWQPARTEVARELAGRWQQLRLQRGAAASG